MFYYITLSVVLFAIGVYGVFTRRDMIGILVASILLFSAASINFVTFNNFIVADGHSGELLALIIITLTVVQITTVITIVLLSIKKMRNDKNDSVSLIDW